MVFLFVGSSALTEASFPRDLAIPQLLLSSACAIVLAMKPSPTAVFRTADLLPISSCPCQAHTRRCSEREPAGSLRNKSNVIGGWLPSLTSTFGVTYACRRVSVCRIPGCRDLVGLLHQRAGSRTKLARGVCTARRRSNAFAFCRLLGP